MGVANRSRRIIDSGTITIGNGTVNLTVPATFKRHVILEHPFARGNLGTAGQQFTSSYTTTGDALEYVATAAINPPVGGNIVELGLGLTCSIKSSGTAESVLFVWQGKNNLGTTWVNLHGTVTFGPSAAVATEYTMSGYAGSVANFGSVPFDICLGIQSGGAGGETAAGSVKNSSYVRATYDEV